MSTQKKTVLIVDANPVDGQTAGMILERFGSGYACDVAAGRQQIEKASAFLGGVAAS